MHSSSRAPTQDPGVGPPRQAGGRPVKVEPELASSTPALASLRAFASPTCPAPCASAGEPALSNGSDRCAAYPSTDDVDTYLRLAHPDASERDQTRFASMFQPGPTSNQYTDQPDVDEKSPLHTYLVMFLRQVPPHTWQT